MRHLTTSEKEHVLIGVPLVRNHNGHQSDYYETNVRSPVPGKIREDLEGGLANL